MVSYSTILRWQARIRRSNSSTQASTPPHRPGLIMILGRINAPWHLYPLYIKLNQRSDPGKFSLSLLYEIPVFKPRGCSWVSRAQYHECLELGTIPSLAEQIPGLYLQVDGLCQQKLPFTWQPKLSPDFVKHSREVKSNQTESNGVRESQHLNEIIWVQSPAHRWGDAVECWGWPWYPSPWQQCFWSLCFCVMSLSCVYLVGLYSWQHLLKVFNQTTQTPANTMLLLTGRKYHMSPFALPF